MEAISIIDNKSKVNQMRCIGCGACVLTCTSEVISLKNKVEAIIPPKNTADTYMQIMKAKHQLSITKKN
jgi:Fe-S-cluster-containing hydrogenase component 2